MKFISILRCLYYTSCVIVAAWFISRCIHQYSLDNDVTRVEYNKFDSPKERMYPELTICFGGTTIFAGGSFKNVDSKQNVTSNGDQWSNKPLLTKNYYQIGDTQATLDIEDYITKVTIKDLQNNHIDYTSNAKEYQSEVRNLTSNAVLRRYGKGNCFALGVPFLEDHRLKSILVQVKKAIFTRGLFPTNQEMITGSSKFSLGLSSGNRFFPLFQNSKKIIPFVHHRESDYSKCHGLIFTLRGTEIIRNRNKESAPCNDYGYDEGIQVLDDLSNDLGCKPHHWNLDTHLPDCLSDKLSINRKDIDAGLYQSNKKSLINPCSTLYSVYSDCSYDMTPDSCNDEKETFDITIVHDDHPIKEITTSAAYNERSLVEDICTIAGVLFSALQLPWFIKKLVDYCKHDEPIAQNREESDDRIDDNDVGNGTSINLLIQKTALKSQITTLEDRLNELDKIGKYSREESEDVIYDNDPDQVASNSLVVPNYNMSDTVVWIKETAV